MVVLRRSAMGFYCDEAGADPEPVNGGGGMKRGSGNAGRVLGVSSG